MTLRIAKMEEPRQKKRVTVEEPVTDIVAADVNNPEPEVVGIPGLVRQMIGRFSYQDFNGVSNGISHSTRSSVKPSTAPLAQAKPPLVSLVAGPQRNASPKISKTHTHCEESKKVDEPLRTESSDLHSSRSSSRTRPNQRASDADESIDTSKFISRISDSDSNRNLSESNSAPVTIDARNITAPPLHPKSERALNLYRTSPETQGSSLSNCDGQTNKLHNSEIKEVNSSPSFVGLQNRVNISVGESFSEINQKNHVPNGQCHIIPVVNGNHENVGEMEKCFKNDEIDDVQKTENGFHQKPNEKDGHYFLGVMSDVEQELTKHCTQLEQFLSGPITDEASGKVRAAIGKANLLMTRKFKQFEQLCHKNLIDSKDEPFKTTSEDLTGFWDLVHLQVDDVQRLFSEIYQLHGNHWIDMEPEETLLSPKVMEVKPKEQLLKSASKKAKSPGTSEASKAREEARKRLLAAKMAGRQRKASEREEDDVQIFIS